MNGKNFVTQLFAFILYLTLQILIVRNLVFLDVAFCFVYIGFLLLLPFDTGVIALMFIGFATGLVVDIFYDSLGMHTAACVLIMFFRNKYITLITPRGGMDNIPTPSLATTGQNWFSTYTIFLIFVHHAALFFIEASGSDLFLFTLTKVIASTIFTYLLIVFIQYLFYPSKRTA